MSLRNSTVTTKLYTLVGVFAFGIIGYGIWSYNTLSLAKVNGPYYQRISQGKDLVADALPPPVYIIEAYCNMLQLNIDVQAEAGRTAIEATVLKVSRLKSEYETRHKYWASQLEDCPLKQALIVDAYQPAMDFFRICQDQYLPACMAGNKEQVAQLLPILRSKFEFHRASIDNVVELVTARTVKEEAEVSALLQSRIIWSVVLVCVQLLVTSGFGWWTAQATVQPLRHQAFEMRELATRDLSQVSERMQTNARQTSHQATLASGAAEQVSTNAQALASAVEQFEVSIREISSNTSGAAMVARNAVEAVEKTTTTITNLGQSSSEISEVVKMINWIAEQTNHLALNATIEAARAGEAGKGFAVVANEVKELAKQTRQATEDIVQKIEAIQEGSHAAVDAIREVSSIITQINMAQTAIAGAVEEQTAMTTEISRNISEVAAGSGEIARNITLVAEAAQSTSDGTAATLGAANSIQTMASNLMQLVGDNTGSVNVMTYANENATVAPMLAGKYRLKSTTVRSVAESV